MTTKVTQYVERRLPVHRLRPGDEVLLDRGRIWTVGRV
jgi:hypothetical protein